MSTRPVTPAQMITRAIAFGIAAPLFGAGLGLAAVWLMIKVLA